MHIPDGLLDPVACATTALVSVGAAGYALRRVRQDLPERAVPVMGVMAACVFAAQMLNFPVPGGTSGHFLGGVLAAVLLGPWGGMLVMTIVLIVQCLLFQDGGVTALGANILNVAVIGSGVGYVVYDLLRRQIGGLRGILMGAMIASWVTVMAAATLCSLEISWGGYYRLAPTLGAMLLVHSLIGLGEALMTGFALSFVLKTRPDLIYGQPNQPSPLVRSGQVVVAGLVIALLLAAVVSPFASSLPDGLNASMTKLGFDETAASPVLSAPLADYSFAPAQALGLAGSMAGVIGTLVVFVVAVVLSRRWPRGNSPYHA